MFENKVGKIRHFTALRFLDEQPFEMQPIFVGQIVWTLSILLVIS